MSTSLNQHFTPWALLKFAFPSIIMMIFMSLYTIVDGIFISRFLGSNALSSLNIVFPVINVVIAIATMLGTGGNAIISKYLGEGRDRDARECLTQLTVIGLAISLLLLVLTQIFLTPLCRALGSTDVLLADCRAYLSVSLMFAPACMLQTLFQSYLVTAGMPALGLFLTIGAGILNAVLDYVLILVFPMGIAGAAIATGIGQSVPAVAGLFYFLLSRKGLYFTRFRLHPKELFMACYNGSSEMVTQLSNAVITFLFNLIMLELAGENGISPIVGFQYGAGNRKQLRSIYRTSFLFVLASSVALTVIAVISSTPLVSVFTRDPKTFTLADAGFRIFAFNFLFSGFNIASSGFFTALSNGRVSAIISFLRTLVFIVLSLLTLPRFFEITGAWLAIPVAEFLTLVLL